MPRDPADWLPPTKDTLDLDWLGELLSRPSLQVIEGGLAAEADQPRPRSVNLHRVLHEKLR